jgi:hypothetical protein
MNAELNALLSNFTYDDIAYKSVDSFAILLSGGYVDASTCGVEVRCGLEAILPIMLVSKLRMRKSCGVLKYVRGSRDINIDNENHRLCCYQNAGIMQNLC